MSDKRAIQRALAEAGAATLAGEPASLGGGCVHRVYAVRDEAGGRYVAKLNRPDRAGLFEEEAEGLRTLAATGTVSVPTPRAVGLFEGQAVLLMTALPPGEATEEAWSDFGRALARLHAGDAGARYGFHIDNHLGSTFQPNTWSDDWVEFNARYRLGYQIELARGHGRLSSRELAPLHAVVDRLEDFIPRRPHPALLHGDLWCGNALPSADAGGRPRVAVIDPACSIGDGLADVAMMRLFGGFAPACFAAYEEATGERDLVEPRIAVYQLYHVLNHVNLFGRGYAGQAMDLVRRLGDL